MPYCRYLDNGWDCQHGCQHGRIVCHKYARGWCWREIKPGTGGCEFGVHHAARTQGREHMDVDRQQTREDGIIAYCKYLNSGNYCPHGCQHDRIVCHKHARGRCWRRIVPGAGGCAWGLHHTARPHGSEHRGAAMTETSSPTTARDPWRGSSRDQLTEAMPCGCDPCYSDGDEDFPESCGHGQHCQHCVSRQTHLWRDCCVFRDHLRRGITPASPSAAVEATTQSGLPEWRECPVCWEEQNEQTTVWLPCAHAVCTECWANLRSRQGLVKCPMCRKQTLGSPAPEFR